MDRGGENPKEATGEGEGDEYAPEQGLLLTDLRVARGEPSLEYVWGETFPQLNFSGELSTISSSFIDKPWMKDWRRHRL